MTPFDTQAQATWLEQLKGECARCRASIDAHWQLCAPCELRLATRCPGCGMALPPAGCRQCGHCGRLLVEREDARG